MCKCQAPVWQGVRSESYTDPLLPFKFFKFHFYWVCEWIYVCADIHVCLCTCMYACMWRPKLISGVLLIYCPPYFFETNSDWIWSSPILPVWLSNKPRNPPVSATLVTGLQTHTVSQTSCGFWGLNSSPHEDMASILPAEPSPQPPYVILMVRSGLNW